MQYQGGKVKIANYIAAYINEQCITGAPFYDLFSGGCNIIARINAKERYANDINKYVIAANEYSTLDLPFPYKDGVSEALFHDMRENKDKYPPWLVGTVLTGQAFGKGFNCAYARCKQGVDYYNSQVRTMKKLAPQLKGVKFSAGSYDEVKLKPNSVIYCDIPYKGTGIYRGMPKFDYEKFYIWVNEIAKSHYVMVSEYKANFVEGAELLTEIGSFTTIGSSMKNKKPTQEILMGFGKPYVESGLPKFVGVPVTEGLF